MTQVELLEAIKKLSPSERLEVIDAALHLFQQDLRHVDQPPKKSEMGELLAAAARALLPDYSEDKELTAFAALDGEDFHAPG